ncbi:MAG: hypothetical protein HRU12_11760 [Phaeodactylibacter sp.]|nr:hypothetical protein [Phaeodactylibacter sp.]
MATTQSYSGNFAGLKAAGYIAPALYSGATLGTPLVTIHENIKYRLNVRSLDVSSDIIRDASCDFNATSTITTSDIILQPKNFQVNLTLCFDDWYDQWEAETISGARRSENEPREFMDFLMDRVSARVSKNIENLTWNGTNTTNQFTGLITRLGAADVSQTTLTVQNILAEMQKAYNAIDEDVYDEEDVVWVINKKTKKLYQQALATGQVASGTNISSLDDRLVVGEKPMDYLGIPISVAPGLGDNRMVIARRSDLHFGTNLLTDFTNVQVVDTRETLADNNLRIAMKFACDTQVTNREDITYYG